MNKKLRKLGFLSATALPLFVAIACSPVALTEDQQEMLDRIKSTAGKNAIQRMWLEKLVADYMIEDTIYFSDVTLNSGDPETDAKVNGENLFVLQQSSSKNYIIDQSVFSKVEHVQRAFKFMIEDQQSQDESYINNFINALRFEPEFDTNYVFKKDDKDEVLPNQYRATKTTNFDVIGFGNPKMTESWLTWLANSSDIKIELTYTKGTEKSQVKYNWIPNGGWPAGDKLANDTPGEITLDTYDKKLDWIMTTLFRSDRLGFVNEIYRMILSQKLHALNYEDWSKVYYEEYKTNNSSDIVGSNKLNRIHELIDPNENFYLTMKTVDGKYAINHKIETSTSELSTLYKLAGSVEANKHGADPDVMKEFDKHLMINGADVNHENGAYESLLKHLNDKGNVQNFGTYKTHNTQGFINVDPLVASKDIYGYMGMTELPTGSGKLKLDNPSDWQNIDSDTYLDGYYSKVANKGGDLVTTNDTDGKIALSLEEAEPEAELQINIQRYISMLPIYQQVKVDGKDENKLSYKSVSKWKENTHLISWYIYNKNQAGVFSDIEKYFIDENGGDYKLKISSKFIYEELSKMGINYIEYDSSIK